MAMDGCGRIRMDMDGYGWNLNSYVYLSGETL